MPQTILTSAHLQPLNKKHNQIYVEVGDMPWNQAAPVTIVGNSSQHCAEKCETSPYYCCNLPKGHTSPHVAWQLNGIVRIWKDEKPTTRKQLQQDIESIRSLLET